MPTEGLSVRKPDKKFYMNMDPSPMTPDQILTEAKASCSTDDDATQDLYFIRIEKNTEPFIHKLNYDTKYLKQFKQIISESDASMKQSERVKFWQVRSQTNENMIGFLNNVQDQIFSYAKYYLLGSLYDPKSNLPNGMPKSFQDELDIVYEKLGLNGKNSAIEQKQIIFHLMNSYEHVDRNLLKKAFKQANLNEKQYKLFDAHLAKIGSKLKELASTFRRKHICLLIDKYLHQIPWECLTILKQQCITRMPSIHFLLSHLQLSKLSLRKDSAYYIVDPVSIIILVKC